MTRAQTWRSVAYGIAFWFVAAMVVRFAGETFDGGLINAILLAVSVPIAAATMPVARALCGVGDDRLLDATVVATIAATLADGIAITYASEALYAGVTARSQFGAAWILWGVGWLLLFAYRRSRAA